MRLDAALGAGLLALTGCTVVPAGAVGPAPVQTAPAPAAPAAAAPVRPAAPEAFRYEGQRIQGGMLVGTAPAGVTALTFESEAVALSPDRRFLIAFDRDAGPSARLVARFADGHEQVETFAVAPRAWQIERLPTLPKVSQPSAEFQRRRPPELAQIVAARKLDTGAQGWSQRFQWPATGRISGRFGSQRIYAGEPGSYHSGVDVAKPTGAPVKAPADGVVILAAASPFTLEGNLLMLDHGMGLNSAFLHLSRIDVKPGEHVRQGQVIGAVGSTGRATGPHLHWGMMWKGRRLDPLLITGPMPD
ncbi:M23 family metallopeptidase [Sphingomonas sp. ac-8]|uniref:M23 family metallopeptidase n=1 Tax=Sphingomonas sp. ac-8 TaxID=3242977 RepID=UPI003A80CC4E